MNWTAEEKMRMLFTLRQQGVTDTAVLTAMERIDRSFDPERDFVLVAADRDWHPGVIGIVASRLVARYHRPAIVIALNGEGRGRGSGRSIEALDLAAALRDCSGDLLRCGGHAMAAGLDIEETRVDAFRSRLNSVVAARFGGQVPPPVLSIDAWIGFHEADESLLAALDRAKPYGQGNPAPVWAVRGVEVESWQVLKDKHVRLRLRGGNVSHNAIGFNLAERGRPEGAVDVAFELRRDTWNGRNGLQLHVRDFRSVETGG